MATALVAAGAADVAVMKVVGTAVYSDEAEGVTTATWVEDKTALETAELATAAEVATALVAAAVLAATVAVAEPEPEPAPQVATGPPGRV